MPNYHFRIKSDKRSRGKTVSATDHCDYINREGRYRDYDQKSRRGRGKNSQKQDEATRAASHLQYINRESVFQKRGGCVYARSHLPKWADGSAKKFFEAADRYERANGERYKEIEFSLPNELDLEEHKKIVEEFLDHHLRDYYYSYAIHDKIGSMSDGERQPHVHIMFSTREIDNVERTQERSPERFFKQYNRKNPEKGGCQKAKKWYSAERRKYLVLMREDYANIQNEALARNGINLRVDHRTLKAQREEALANGNYLLADLLDRKPEKSVGPVELLKGNSAIVEEQKKLRSNKREREKMLYTRYMLKDTIDKTSTMEITQDIKNRGRAILSYGNEIEDVCERDYYIEEKKKIVDMEKEMAQMHSMVILPHQAIEKALLDAMTKEEKERWQELKNYGQEKREWENLKNNMIEPAFNDYEGQEAYIRIKPQIDIELDRVNREIRQAASDLRPVFDRLSLPHNKDNIRRQAAMYLNDHRQDNPEITRRQEIVDKRLDALDNHLKEYFTVTQSDRIFTAEEAVSILKASIARQEKLELKIRDKVDRLKKKYISYPRALEMAKNNYVHGAFKQLREDKRELKKREEKLSPSAREDAWQEIRQRERKLEDMCNTPVAREKIETIAAGILRKNVSVAKSLRELNSQHRNFVRYINHNREQAKRAEIRSGFERGNKFRVAPPTPAPEKGSGGGGGCGCSYPTPSRSADLISKAIDGSPKEAQLVARSKPDEPDDWKWLSEADKDDLKNDLATLDRW